MERAVDKPGTNWPILLDSGIMEKFFNAPFDVYSNFGKAMSVPAVNIAETDEEFRVTIAAPGLRKFDFKIESFEDVLTISVEKTGKIAQRPRTIQAAEQRFGRWNRHEYNYRSWNRSFTLAQYVDVEKAEAKYENGELKITLPKTGSKDSGKVKTIEVT